MSTKEKRMWDSMAPEEQQEFWNGMSQSEQIAFAQAMEHPQQVQPKPDQAKGAKSRLFQQGSRPIFTYTEAMKTSVAGEKKLSLYRTNFEDAGVAGDYVSPTSTNYSARMNKTVLGVVMVVVFCITWWLVAGEAKQAAQKAEQAYKQAEKALQQAREAREQLERAMLPAKQAYEEARKQAKQAYEEAYEQVRKQAKKPTYGQEGFVWMVGEEVEKAYGPGERAYQQAKQQAHQQVYQQVYKEAWQADQPGIRQAEVAVPPAKQASIMADAHFRTQGSWGIGAGLLADVVILVGALAWSKLTAKA